jgi:hypothetical protein
MQRAHRFEVGRTRMSNNSANTSRLAISALPLLNGTILQYPAGELH